MQEKTLDDSEISVIVLDDTDMLPDVSNELNVTSDSLNVRTEDSKTESHISKPSRANSSKTTNQNVYFVLDDSTTSTVILSEFCNSSNSNGNKTDTGADSTENTTNDNSKKSIVEEEAIQKHTKPNDSVVEVIDLSDSDDCVCVEEKIVSVIVEDEEEAPTSQAKVKSIFPRSCGETPDFIPLLNPIYPISKRRKKKFTKRLRTEAAKRLSSNKKMVSPLKRSMENLGNSSKETTSESTSAASQNHSVSKKRKVKKRSNNKICDEAAVVEKRAKIPQISLAFSNIVKTDPPCVPRTGLRPVVIDGANVGRKYSSGHFIMSPVLKVIDYFKKRGHNEIICFLPHTLKHVGASPEEQLIVGALEREGIMSFTPRRKTADGKRICPYDDRIIIQYATEKQGVIITNDQYRDLINEDPAWRETIENRVINYTRAGDMIMFPKDPLGPLGPTLDEILRFPG